MEDAGTTLSDLTARAFYPRRTKKKNERQRSFSEGLDRERRGRWDGVKGGKR